MSVHSRMTSKISSIENEVGDQQHPNGSVTAAPPLPNSMVRVGPSAPWRRASGDGGRQKRNSIHKRASLSNDSLAIRKVAWTADRMPLPGQFEGRPPQIAILESDVPTSKTLIGDTHV